MMENSLLEVKYPITFRQTDANTLGKHLQNRHSVVLIGIKRVGISNFLHFFLNHKDITRTYLDDQKHLFIPVDLFDLVEREIFPFWTLTFKRVVDIVNKSPLSPKTKKLIESLFMQSIQSHHLFLTMDALRESIIKITEEGFLPTIFFNRFDRMKSAATPALLDNLQGLREATNGKLCFVFTSFRNLDQLAPLAFDTKVLSAFSYHLYFKPAERKDTQIIYNTYKTRYKLMLTPSQEEALFEFVDGYTQYLHLALVSILEQKPKLKTKEELFQFLISDERIGLQSEEIWGNLEIEEQKVLENILLKKPLTDSDKRTARYLWDCGLVKNTQIFSPLFSYFILKKNQKIENHIVEFSKKEHMLFMFLKLHSSNICAREKIIEAVWPEVEAFGVSDWAIDRLIARVRHKLKLQKNPFEIHTIKTRGYKLTPITSDDTA